MNYKKIQEDSFREGIIPLDRVYVGMKVRCLKHGTRQSEDSTRNIATGEIYTISRINWTIQNGELKGFGTVRLKEKAPNVSYNLWRFGFVNEFLENMEREIKE